MRKVMQTNAASPCCETRLLYSSATFTFVVDTMIVRHVVVVTEGKAIFLPRVDPQTLRHGRPG